MSSFEYFFFDLAISYINDLIFGKSEVGKSIFTSFFLASLIVVSTEKYKEILSLFSFKKK